MGSFGMLARRAVLTETPVMVQVNFKNIDWICCFFYVCLV